MLAIALVAGIAAAFAPSQPTGIAVYDVLERFAFGVVVTLFAACSRRWTWLVLGGVSTVLAESLAGNVLGAIGLGFAVYSSVRSRRRDRLVGAVVGALCSQVLLRTADVGFFGLTAIIVAVTVIVVMVSGYRTMRRRNRRRIGITAGVIVVLMALATAGLAFTALAAEPSLDSATAAAKKGLHEAVHGNQKDAGDQWGIAHRYFADAEAKLSSPLSKLAYPIPVVSQHAQLVVTAAGSGTEITGAAEHAAKVAPYDSLRAADGTFDLKRIESMEAPVAHTVESMVRSRDQLAATTNPWLVDSVEDRATSYQDDLTRTIPEARGALRAIRIAPEVLGGNGTRHYLLLFANPAETRGMGGFIGAWAQLDASNGHLQLVRHGKMGELDDASDPASRKITGEKTYLERYGHLQPARFIQNVSASPDFPTVARVAEQLYPQAGGQKVDGVMYVDPIALGALLKLTGPVKADGIPMPLTSKNAAKFLMHEQYLEFPNTNDRTDLLSNAAEATFDALTHRALPPISAITDALAPMMHERRLLATVNDHAADSYFRSIGLTGAFPHPKGHDLLSVRVANGSANKADYYLKELTAYDVTHNPATGSTSGTISVLLKNSAPAGGEPAYVLGNQDTRAGRTDGRPFGSTTLQVSIHTALRPVSMTIGGIDVGVQVERELGSWVATQTVTIPAGDTAELRLKVAGQLQRGPYRLVVTPQALATSPTLAIAAHKTHADGSPNPGAGHKWVTSKAGKHVFSQR